MLIHYDLLRLTAEDVLDELERQGLATRPTPAPEASGGSIGGAMINIVVGSVVQHAVERSIVKLLPMLL